MLSLIEVPEGLDRLVIMRKEPGDFLGTIPIGLIWKNLKGGCLKRPAILLANNYLEMAESITKGLSLTEERL